MDLDTDELLKRAMGDAIREGVKKQLVDGYSSPLMKLVTEAIGTHAATIRKLLEEGIASCVADPEFREQMKAAVRQQLAKTLIQKFGGELEKQVNALKSDPTTRARIVLAIEDIVARAA